MISRSHGRLAWNRKHEGSQPTCMKQHTSRYSRAQRGAWVDYEKRWDGHDFGVEVGDHHDTQLR